MADSPVYGTTLTDTLRRMLRDTSYRYPQFDLQLASPATTALVEVQDTSFIVTASGVGVAGVTLDLTSPTYDSIEKLVNYLNQQAGYQATFIADGDAAHASDDLQIIPPTVCLNKRVQFSTRKWSDAELSAAIDRAIARHDSNMPRDPALGWLGGYTANTLPQDHQQFVLVLAQIEVYNIAIQMGMRRQGLDLSYEAYTSLVNVLEKRYTEDFDRWIAKRNRQSLPLTALHDLGSGDIVQGYAVRNSLRNGTIVPAAGAELPQKETLTLTALGNGKVQVNWTRNRDARFWFYEIRRSTSPVITNNEIMASPPGSVVTDSTVVTQEYRQWQTLYIDGFTTALAPGTYYYALYVYNKAGGASDSRYTYASSYQRSDFTVSDILSVVVT